MKIDQQKLAKDLYLQADKSQSEIAEILNVNRKTIYLWMKKGRWEEIKIASRQSPGFILQNVYNHIDEVNKKIGTREDKCPTMLEVEMLRKLLKMTKDINRKNTGFYIEAFEELTYFIARKDIKDCHQFTKYADQFIKGTFGDCHFYVEQRVTENVQDINDNLAKEDKRYPNPETPPPGKPASNTPDAFTPPPAEKNEPPQAENDTKTTMAGHGTLPLGEGRGGANGAFSNQPENPPKTTTVNTLTGKTPQKKCPTSTTKKSEPNGAQSTAILGEPRQTTPTESVIVSLAEQCQLKTATYYATLPPHLRPSPFREGNIIWVNHISDADKISDTMKMSDSIRHYPDMYKGANKQD